MPSLIRWGAGRQLLYIDQTLPLRRGDRLNIIQEKQLGIVQPKPGELERLQRENNELTQQVLNKLEDATKR
jgi:hypothetical protein